MTRSRKRGRRVALHGSRRRLPAWAWLLLAAAAAAVAHGAWTAWERHRVAQFRAAVPAPDLGHAEPRVAAAIEAARRSTLDAPLSAQAWGELAAVLDVHGFFEPAAASYGQARRLDGQDFRWTYLLAIVRDVGGADIDEVERLFREAIERRADYAPAWFRLGHALSLRGAQDAARDALARAIDIDPQGAIYHRELGQVLLALDDVPAALGALERARELAPRDGAVWSALAQAYGRAGRPEDARDAAARVAGLPVLAALDDPVHGRFVAARGVSTVQLLERAGMRLDRGNYLGALETLGPVLADEPANAHARYLAGTAHARLGDTDAAHAGLGEALRLDPDHVGALLESGVLLEGEGRRSEALALYDHAHSAAPGDTEVLLSLARVRVQVGDDPGAIHAFESLAATADLDARTLMNWGNALSRVERTPEAVERYRLALAREPGYAHAHFNLGLALEALGRRDEAVRHFREAARLDPSLPAAEPLARLGAAH